MVEDNLRHGLGTLHLYIKCFEQLLGIAYRLIVKKWRGRKVLWSDRKKEIQGEFKKLGKRVDCPKVGGGNTNCGNLARWFFQNTHESSRITDLPEDIINDFGIILILVNCGQQLNTTNFHSLLQSVKAKLINLYPWMEIKPTVHKLLDHGAAIIDFHYLSQLQLR